MKIGVFGGTFNPIHNSHLYLANEFYKQLKLDTVFVLPTYIPPHKPSVDLIDAKDRYNMCLLACEDYPHLQVSDYEINRQGKSYTYETLQWLSQKYSGSQLLLLMGSDMYLTVDQWRKPEAIYAQATLCAISRQPGEYESLVAKEQELAANGAKSIILNIAPKPMSSTEIRSLIHEGKSVADYLPEKVIAYIGKHKLYRGQ